MLKALFRKQFMEFAAMLFRNRKNGARRTGAKAVLFIILFALAFLSVAFMFFMRRFMFLSSHQITPSSSLHAKTAE